MAKGKLLDFDQFWAETQPEDAELPRVRVFGEEVTLPASIPAIIVIRYLRQGVDEDEPIGGDTLVQVADALFGRETLDRWLNRGLTITQLGDLVSRTLNLYMGGGDEDAESDDENPT